MVNILKNTLDYGEFMTHITLYKNTLQFNTSDLYVGSVNCINNLKSDYNAL